MNETTNKGKLYTPIRISLAGKFMGYDESCYVDLRPIAPSEAMEIAKIANAANDENGLEVVNNYTKYFLQGKGKDKDGNSVDITKEDFEGLLLFLSKDIQQALVPSEVTDPNFTTDSSDI